MIDRVINKTIVLFGGTFNPIHSGHIEPVLAAAQSVSADKLLYLPCHLPPHKAPPTVTSEHRLAMAELAVKDIQSPVKVEVSDYELRQKGTSYTRKTVEFFKDRYPEHKIYFLIGMDSLLNFNSWFKWQEIFSFCDLLVMQRPNYILKKLEEIAPELNSQFKEQIHITRVDEVNISSTELRQAISLNQTPALLPESVNHYIAKHGLYK